MKIWEGVREMKITIYRREIELCFLWGFQNEDGTKFSMKKDK